MYILGSRGIPALLDAIGIPDIRLLNTPGSVLLGIVYGYLPLMILPFLGSGFVPTESMPGWLQWFAEHQPFTPMVEGVRGLLDGTPGGSTVLIALVWCAVLSLVGYLWARHLYEREPADLAG
jgi:ABC-type multidrug transport system permease subunit